MAELTSKERQDALALADLLTELAVMAPTVNLEQRMQRMIQVIRQEYGFSYRHKKAEVLVRVRKGLSTVRELSESTKWHRTLITELVTNLEHDGAVRIERIAPAGMKGGRPALRIFPIDR